MQHLPVRVDRRPVLKHLPSGGVCEALGLIPILWGLVPHQGRHSHLPLH
jgi:hypothetical protein